MYELYTDKRGEWRWRFRDQEFKKILFISSERYKRQIDAENSINRAKNSMGCKVVHLNEADN